MYVGETKDFFTPCDFSTRIGDAEEEIQLANQRPDYRPDGTALSIPEAPPAHSKEGKKIFTPFPTECYISDEGRLVAVVGIRPSPECHYIVPVTFIVKTDAPFSFINATHQAMLVDSGFLSVHDRVVVPTDQGNWLHIKQSPAEFANVNILGMDILSQGCLIFCKSTCKLYLPFSEFHAEL